MQLLAKCADLQTKACEFDQERNNLLAQMETMRQQQHQSENEHAQRMAKQAELDHRRMELENQALRQQVIDLDNKCVEKDAKIKQLDLRLHLVQDSLDWKRCAESARMIPPDTCFRRMKVALDCF